MLRQGAVCHAPRLSGTSACAAFHSLLTQRDFMTPDAPTPRRHTERAQPESFRAVSLQASLTVKDLTKSVAWYRDVIGFIIDKEYERDGRRFAVALKAGAVRILVNQDDGAKGLD